MTRRWLHLRLSAPLMAFGSVSIDHVGPTRDVPAASALTGLFANALGWRRQDGPAHQALQDRLIFGALIARQGRLLTDSQNVMLDGKEKGWTTRGQPEGRAGGTYSAPHRRRRDYLADHDCHVVLHLIEGEGPDLEQLATALDRPVRPLFIGRKPCLPSARLFEGWVEGDTAKAALVALGIPGRAFWPPEHDEMPLDGTTVIGVADLRNWVSGLHGGSRALVEGHLP